MLLMVLMQEVGCIDTASETSLQMTAHRKTRNEQKTATINLTRMTLSSSKKTEFIKYKTRAFSRLKHQSPIGLLLTEFSITPVTKATTIFV